jgi:hypothetical protein
VRQTGFINPLRVEAVDACHWALLDDFTWIGSKGDAFICQKGMLTDFASVPWWSQSLIPRTGAWTKAAVVHDKMCDELNNIHQVNKTGAARVLLTPTFSAIDTDAIFRKNARELGTDPIRSELLWMGVRFGALANPARRKGWWSTAPRVGADALATLVFLYLLTYVILWIANVVL